VWRANQFDTAIHVSHPTTRRFDMTFGSSIQKVLTMRVPAT
jgi:hypothetical protein